MKKLLVTLLLGLSTLTFAWGAEPNYEIKKERGQRVVYENNRPAKGTITWSVYDDNYDSVVVSEFEVKNGVLSGDFTLFNTDNIPVVVGKGKVRDEIFNGTITFTDHNEGAKVVAKGTFKINNDLALDNDGSEDALANAFMSLVTLSVDAKFNGDISLTVKNGELTSNFVQNYVGTNTPQMVKSKANGSTTYYRENGVKESAYFSDMFISFDENGEVERIGVNHKWDYNPPRNGEPAKYHRCNEEFITKITPIINAVINDEPIPDID